MTHNIQIKKDVKNGHKKQIIVDGISYASIRAFYREYGIHDSLVNKAKHEGMSQEEAIDYAIEYTAYRNSIKESRRREGLEKQKKRHRQAYRTVFDDLSKCPLFMGYYDAKNCKEDLMYGISTVMEFIAGGVSEECLDNFNKTFSENMRVSEERAKEWIKK